MDTATLTPIYQQAGPFATALVDVGHDNENGDHEHALRVRAVCDELTEQGAPESVVAAVEARLGELVERPAPIARLVVASPDGIAHDEVVGVRVDQPVSTWGPLPDLGPWIERRDSALTFVLVLVDHEGGDIAVYDSEIPEPQEEETAGGETRFVHKVPVGGWSALRYQHNTENVWRRNAEAVVQEVRDHVRRGHRLVLLAGDPKTRGIVRAQLEDTKAELIELETGTRAEDGGEEALQQAIREALMTCMGHRRAALADALREQHERDGASATGVDEVAEAFVRGQVETLLIDPGEAAAAVLDAARHPGLSLGEATPSGPVRADQALIAAAVLTGAAVSVNRREALADSPAAALLRWDQKPVADEV
jgi:Bacterial archaeo-eukaryotic release factor family 2